MSTTWGVHVHGCYGSVGGMQGIQVHSSLPFSCSRIPPPVQPSAPDLKIELTEEERERADELDEAALRRQVSVA